ncbi:MAG: tetratricopeptide repeat protein [Myxococcaceae bacterium]|nr:tetratricopeptide repeat protein [Myxococcaceae bacterium]MCI0671604.1 tetratricopeptide repeat protein [Myxococcaceae bacterium]
MMRLAKTVVMLAGITLLGTACKDDPAELHRNKGNAHLAKDEYKQAAEEYGLSLKADPKQEKLWERKAWAHMQLGEMDKADEAILKTLDFKTDTAKRAEVYRNLAGVYVQRGPPEKAEQYYLEALKLDPKDDVSLAWVAEIHAQLGGARLATAPAVASHLDKAISYYDKAIAVRPEASNNYINKRIVLLKYMGYLKTQLDEATKDSTSADPAKAQAATLQSRELQTRLEAYKAESDVLMKKFAELQKAAKAAQAKSTP